MKAHHCQELNDLSNKLFEVFHGEVTEREFQIFIIQVQLNQG